MVKISPITKKTGIINELLSQFPVKRGVKEEPQVALLSKKGFLPEPPKAKMELASRDFYEASDKRPLPEGSVVEAKAKRDKKVFDCGNADEAASCGPDWLN